MMQDLVQTDFSEISQEKFGGWMSFECGDKIVKLMSVQDMDGKIIQLPFSAETKIKDLELEYEKKNQIAVKFVVFDLKQIANEDKFVSSFYVNKNLSDVIFQAQIKHKFEQNGEQKSFDEEQERNINISVKIFSGKILTISIYTKNKVEALMREIEKLEGIPFDQQRIVYGGKKMKPNSYICQYDIQNNSTLHLIIRIKEQLCLTFKELQKAFSNLFHQYFSSHQVKFMVIQCQDDQPIILNYKQIRNMKVSGIVKTYVKQMASYWTFAFGNSILNPNEQVLAIQQSQLFQDSEIIRVKIYKYGKYLFLSSIREIQFKEDLFNLKNEKLKLLVQKIKNKLSSEKKLILLPISYYTSIEFYKNLNDYLREFKIKKMQQENSIQYNLCCSLHTSLHELPNFIGIVYRGMGNGYKFSEYCKQNVYCSSSFLSTSRKRRVAQRFATDKNDKKIKGTIFIISSLTGKMIEDYSVFKNEEEVLFLPFTYFYVDKIKKHELYEQVWLCELPSPSLFKANALVWVDDKPIKNLKIGQFIINKDLQILYLTSSRLMKVWVQKFLPEAKNRKINLKIISNMVRSESQSEFQENKKINYQAGLDIIEFISKSSYHDIPILIFCGDLERARKSACKRMPERQNDIKIGKLIKDVKAFVSENW